MNPKKPFTAPELYPAANVIDMFIYGSTSEHALETQKYNWIKLADPASKSAQMFQTQSDKKSNEKIPLKNCYRLSSFLCQTDFFMQLYIFFH